MAVQEHGRSNPPRTEAMRRCQNRKGNNTRLPDEEIAQNTQQDEFHLLIARIERARTHSKSAHQTILFSDFLEVHSK
jgi:hypothetical protein